MKEKKNIRETRLCEAEDQELQDVVGGYSALEWFAKGNMKVWRKCWQCDRDFEYAPGLNLGNANDPWRNFCSPECKQKYDNRYFGQPGNPRP